MSTLNPNLNYTELGFNDFKTWYHILSIKYLAFQKSQISVWYVDCVKIDIPVI